MGYTHYYKVKSKKSPTKLAWRAFLADVEAMIRNSGVLVLEECDSAKPPLLSDDRLVFNGSGSLGHETFVLERKPQRRSDGRQVNWFCKTARKPYDAVVVEALNLAKKHFPWWIVSSSDGDGEAARSPANPMGLVFAGYDVGTLPRVTVRPVAGAHTYGALQFPLDFSAAVEQYFAPPSEPMSHARIVAYVLRELSRGDWRWSGFDGYSFDAVHVVIAEPRGGDVAIY